jgi:hypothetical protein
MSSYGSKMYCAGSEVLGSIYDLLNYISERFSVYSINRNFLKMLVNHCIDINGEVEHEIVFFYLIGRSHMEWDELLLAWNNLSEKQKKPYKKLTVQYHQYNIRDTPTSWRGNKKYKDPDSDSDIDSPSEDDE